MLILRTISSLFAEIRSFNRAARLFLMAMVIDGIVYSGWALFFNFYILNLGFDRKFLGLVNAMPSIAGLIFGIPAGILSDRLGRKRAMLLGVGCFILAYALQISVRMPAVILLAAGIGGAANILYFISQAPFMMQESTHENRTMLFSLSFGLFPISGAVGSLIAGKLPSFFAQRLGIPVDSAAAYRAVLLVSLCVGSLTLVPLAFIREKPRQVGQRFAAGTLKEPSSQNDSLRTLLTVLIQPTTLKLATPNLLVGFGAAILMPYMNIFFAERFALGDAQLGVLFSLSALLTGVGAITAPLLARRLGGRIRAVVVTQGASLVFLLLLGFSSYLPIVAISFLLRSVLMNLAIPLYFAFAMEQVPINKQGTVNSVLELAWQMGWAIGPYLSGVVQQAQGFKPLFVLTSGLYLAAILFTWGFFRKHDMVHSTVAG